jgi:uncharacterized protein YdhG (YjbR/CyaY superfamily)
MAADKSDRTSYFPAIEKKYGQPMTYWFSQMDELADAKYPEQIAFLKEEHGFSQAHANALVMYCRGSTTTRRFNTLDDYLKNADEQTASTVRSIFGVIKKKYPKLESVIAWNQPMLRLDTHYIIGLSVAKNHITLNPFSSEVLESFADKLRKYSVNKKTFQVPLDWKVDPTLLRGLATARLKEIR